MPPRSEPVWLEHWQYEGIDFDRSHRMYHEDAILEFPQSGERFVGRDAFLTWRRQYPANGHVPDPAHLQRRRPLGHREPHLRMTAARSSSPSTS